MLSFRQMTNKEALRAWIVEYSGSTASHPVERVGTTREGSYEYYYVWRAAPKEQ